jgi:23S rRNA (pseudouridine1915-N3)-methyltransferase
LKIKFIQIAKTDGAWLITGISVYTERLNRYISFESKEIEAISVKGKTKEGILIAEADKIISMLKPTDYVVLLDETGQLFNSVDFAGWMNKKFTSVGGDIVFLVGGAYGFHQTIRNRAKESVALSQMTFTHQMVRLIFVEQLYRAMTILRNEPYHHS